MNDPLHMDSGALRDLASDGVVRRGIQYFQEHRVIDLHFEHRRLRAVVDGSQVGVPYVVDIGADTDDELVVDCTCPFDWEPACKHAVAALLAYAARQPVPAADVEGAAAEAVAERARRGRTQVVVEHIQGGGTFGTWRASSLLAGGPGRHHTVQIRSLTERLNHCTCPDLAVNRLGTCKHIEAVLHQVRKQPDAAPLQRLGPPHAAIVLDWDAPEPPRVAVRAPRSPVADLRALCGRHFDADGHLAGALPDALDHLLEDCLGRDDVIVGEDVLGHARRLARQAAHALRARRIGDEFRRCDGRLPGVNARLYPYQVEGVAFLASAGRALLADDMGLGKTLQTIAAATWLIQNEGVRRIVVVCPASLKHQWAREIARFTSASVEIVSGPPEARLTSYRKQAAFTLVNYELVLRDASEIQRMVAPDLLVLDEAQRIKNWRTKTAAAIKSLDTRYAFVLTGTPLENRLEDLYSLMQVVDPQVLGPLWRYLVDFHVTDERGKVLGYRNLTELRRRLAPVMLRRDRTLVRDQLPDRVEPRLDVPLDRRQRELHDEALQTATYIVSQASQERRPLTPNEEHRLMAALQRARMACDAAGLVDKETEGSPKLAELERLLEELCVDGGRKVVVFSQWTRMTTMAGLVAARLGLGSVHLHGGVATGNRGELLDRFANDPSVQVFFSTDAGGVGLNLQAASALINLDVPFNPGVLDQRIARVHRLGQRESVQIVLLCAADSYEAKVWSLLQGKRHLFANVVDQAADEDAVGVSRRLVEMAVATLEPEPPVGQTAPTDAETETATETAEASSAAADRPIRTVPDADLAPVVSAIQAAFGPRIDRILAARGGLVAVLRFMEADDLDLAAGLSQLPARLAQAGEGPPISVAVIDVRTAAALGAVGMLDGRTVVERPTQPPDAVLLHQARAALAAGRDPETVQLAARCILEVLGQRAATTPPPLAACLRWVHGELVPCGLADESIVAAISAAVAFDGAATVPPGLGARLLDAAERTVGTRAEVAGMNEVTAEAK